MNGVNLVTLSFSGRGRFLSFAKKNKFLIILFLIALAIRIAFVFSIPVKLWDETVYINLGYDLSKNPLDYSFANNGWSDFIPGGLYPKAGFRAPLLPYMISFMYFINFDFLIDFVIPFLGALSAIFVYLLGKELFDKNVGLISALFFTFIPLHVFYSSRVLTDVLLTFFVLLTFISFVKGYEKGYERHKVLFGLFLAISLLARYTALWIIPMFFIYLLVRDKSFKFLRDKHLWYAVGVFLLTLLPWFIYGFVEYNNPIGALIHGMKASTYWGGVQPWYFFFENWWLMFSIVGFVFMAGLIYLLYNRKFIKKEVYLLLIWFVFFLSMVIYMPHKEDRFVIPLSPPLIILTAFFVSCLKKYLRIVVVVITLVLVVSVGLSFYGEYNTYRTVNTECFGQIENKLKEIKGDFVIVSENPPLFRYSVKKVNAYYPDNLNEQTIKEFEKSQGKPAYFVFTRFNSGFEDDKLERLKQIMKDNYNLKFECSKDPEFNFIYSNV